MPIRIRKPLDSSFFRRDTVAVAQELLGCTLVHLTDEGEVAGVIVETEAYGPNDPASHAYRGKTLRNADMFGPPGTAYVYKIYGRYWCANVVTAPEGVGEAVLLRAVEPISGLDFMRKNRGVEDPRLLCCGPSRLCAAFGISGAISGHDMTQLPYYIAAGCNGSGRIVAASRIGLSQAADVYHRFYLADSLYISKRAKTAVEVEPGPQTPPPR